MIKAKPTWNYFILTVKNGIHNRNGVSKEEFQRIRMSVMGLDESEDCSSPFSKELGAGESITGYVTPFVDYPLPTVEALEPFPAGSNPMHHDVYHMGCNVSGAWFAMFDQHAGPKQVHNMTDEEKEARKQGHTVWNEDPDYIILVIS